MKRHRKPETVKVGSVVVKIYSRIKRQQLKDGGKVFKYRVYEVEDWTAGPRRLRSFNDHGAALKEAERIARQLSTGEAIAAGMRGPETASYGRAMELLRPTGLALEVAAASVAKSFEILGGDYLVDAARFYAARRPDLLTRRTVAEAIDELIETRQARGKSIRTVNDLRSRLGRFAKAFAVDIGTITTADVQHFLDGLKLAPQTVANFRCVLHTLFSFAEARGYVFKGGNPVSDTEEIDTNGGGAIEIFTPSEMGALLKAAPMDFLPVLALGAFAGLRSAEIARLEWSAVDLAGGFIEVAADKAKTKQRRLVPVLPCLAQWLAPYAGQKGKVWKGTVAGLEDARGETVKGAGIPWKHNALRHSFVSYRLAEIQNAAQVALEAGNSPTLVFRHYRELVKPEAAKAWFAIAPEVSANIIPMKQEVASA
jgi:integrase